MKGILTLGLFIAGAAALAQTAPVPKAGDQTPGTGATRVVLSQGKTVAQAAADWAKAANATVVVDPTITGNVSAATSKLSLEPGLTAVAQANHAEWRRAYLKPSDIPKGADGKIDFGKLRAIVESASSVPNVSVGVLDPATGMISMSTRVPANAQATQDWLKDRVPVYILYRPAIVGSAVGRTGGDPVADYLATQKGGLEAFRNMTPEQRMEASRQGLDMVLNMDPQVMAQMMQQSMQALQSLTPDQKAKLMDMSMRMMSGAANAGGAGAPPPGQ